MTTLPRFLHQNVGRLRSRMGKVFLGERVVFRGKDLHADLKDMGWLELYLFSVTGRRFTAEQLRLMQAIWVYTSYPDARIWNNRVAAFAGSTRSTSGLGITGALALMEAHIYGGGNAVQAISFFLETRKRLEAGGTLDDCIRREMATYRRIAGYGRPLINADERIGPLLALAETVRLADGPHVKLAYAVEGFLRDSGRNLGMTYGGLTAALGADLGLSPSEFCMFKFPCILAGIPPCYIESVENPEGSLFPLPCANIIYEGVEKRRWPSVAP